MQASNVDRTLDAYGNSVERAERLALGHGRFGGLRLSASSLLVEFNECIESRIEVLDPIKMGVDQFDRRDRLAANTICHFRSREACEI